MRAKTEMLNRRQLLAGAAALAVYPHGSSLAAVGKNAAEGSHAAYRRDLTKADVDKMMKELSNWGRWGKDDKAGTVNLITPAKRRQAAQLVKDGVSVSLALDADIAPEDVEAPASVSDKGSHYTWRHVMLADGLGMQGKSGFAVDTYETTFHGFKTTHMDALCHYIYEGHIYNGFPASTITKWGSTKVNVMAFEKGILTRGILADMPLLNGVPYLGEDEAIFPEDLEAWEKKAGLRIGSGDALLIRTGRWARMKAVGAPKRSGAMAGLYASCAIWLKERNIAILGSDGDQDVMPSRIEGISQPVHQILLVALGTPVIDNCQLEGLSQAAAERKRWEFMLSLDPLRVPGGTGSPLNPIATF